MLRNPFAFISMLFLSACAFNQSAVLSAIQKEHFETIPRLVEQGKQVNISDENGRTPLMLLVEKGHWEKYDQEKSRQFLGMLMEPQQYPEFMALTALINGGIDVNAVDVNGRTALILAAQKGNVLMVRVLLHYKADPKIRDANGYTALAYAENDEIISLLQQSEEENN